MKKKKKKGRMQMPFHSPRCLIYDNVCVYPYQITLTTTNRTKRQASHPSQMTGIAPEFWCEFLWVQNYSCIYWWNNYNKCLEAWRTWKSMNACAPLSIWLMQGCYTDQCQAGKSLGIWRPSLQNLFYDNYFKATTEYYPLKSTAPGKKKKLLLSLYTPKMFKFSNLKGKTLKRHM